MTVLDKLISWLQTFPLWEGEKTCVDSLMSTPGSVGLYPRGIREMGRREDVLGNVEVVNRLQILLCRVTAGEDDRAEDAAWLLALQDWVRQQSAAGLAPRLGDVPEKEWIRAEQGRLKTPVQTGTGRYAVTITAEYAVAIDNYLIFR